VSKVDNQYDQDPTVYTAVKEINDQLHYFQSMVDSDSDEAYLDMHRPIPDAIVPGEELVRTGALEAASLADAVDEVLDDG